MANRFRARTKTAGASSGYAPGNSPTLVLDFVPVTDPVASAALDLNFTAASYTTTQSDPVAPNAKLNLLIWN